MRWLLVIIPIQSDRLNSVKSESIIPFINNISFMQSAKKSGKCLSPYTEKPCVLIKLSVWSQVH